MKKNMYQKNKKYKKFIKKSGDYGGPFIRTVFYYFFSRGNGGSRSHVETEF